MVETAEALRVKDLAWMLVPSAAGWLVLSLLAAPGFYFGMHAASEMAAFSRALTASLPWAVLAWMLLAYNRWSWQRGDLGRAGLALQGMSGVVLMLALVSLAWWRSFPVLGLGNAVDQRAYARMVWVAWPRAFAMYVGVWALCQAAWLWRAYRRYRQHFVSTELRRLRTQLNPHFLFNTLNAISELGYKDPATADRTITQLSSLLRKSLDGSHQREIALRDELDFLRRYLDIQQTLLQGRLEIKTQVEDNTLNARVPSMILQPLAENAVIHGVGRSGRGWLHIRAERRADALVLEVRDNGWGLALAEARSGREGIGIRNTRARLRYLYGGLARLELLSRPGEGLTARLSIPFHEAYAYDEDPYPDR